MVAWGGSVGYISPGWSVVVVCIAGFFFSLAHSPYVRMGQLGPKQVPRVRTHK